MFRDASRFLNGVYGGALHGVEEFDLVMSDTTERGAEQAGIFGDQDVGVHRVLGSEGADVAAPVERRVDRVAGSKGAKHRLALSEESFNGLLVFFEEGDRTEAYRFVQMDLFDTARTNPSCPM